MTITILDPTHEEDSKIFQMAAGFKNLIGARIGFISNGKNGTSPSAPAATEIMYQVTKWDAVVTGVGD